MYTQKIFQAGNSLVVAIPKDLQKKLGFKLGSSVAVKSSPDDTQLVIEKPTFIKQAQKDMSQKAHQEWLKVFMDENSEILDELAKH